MSQIHPGMGNHDSNQDLPTFNGHNLSNAMDFANQYGHGTESSINHYANITDNFTDSMDHHITTWTGDGFVDASKEEWDRLMDAVCAAPALPNLKSVDQPNGGAATIQNFYEGRPICKCCINWVEKQPAKVPEEAQEKYNGVAIRVYHGKDHSQETRGGLKPITPLWVIIQSPILLRILEPIFKRLGSVVTAEGSVQLIQPFIDLFFAHTAISKAYLDSENGSEIQTHLQVLTEVAEELLRETTTTVTDLHSKDVITWQYLWTLFPKYTIVVTKTEGHECLYEVMSFDNVAGSMTARDVSFDGSNFGYRTRRFAMPQFWGAREIQELICFPLSFHSKREKMESRTIQRNLKVLKYQDILHAAYCKSTEHAPSVVERIIIDPYSSRKSLEQMTVERLSSEDDALDEKLKNHFQKSTCKTRPDAERIKVSADFVSSKPQWLLLLSPFIAGYSLRRHEFDEFYVEYIREIQWNDQAFERLVFPEDSKDLLLTLVKNHRQMKTVGQDLISGKGDGFIVLLSGPPGTGKTLTAEAVADQSKRPFYRIQAETFNRYYEDVESLLEESLQRAADWNAVLLIDEADAYLSSGKDGRSSLVRILMTQMEYYNGVLFLTTNFPENIDEAFASRIDVHLEYPSLERESRRRLLKSMVEFTTSPDSCAQPTDLSEQEYWDLSKWELNGRELKNAVKVAIRMCSTKRERLTHSGLKTAIRHSAPQKFSLQTRSSPSAKRARID